ncbi:hypothetical protein GJ744_012315 [Endocarpon pusillum]|uniref:Uncharacterized protein n=1 Tax=Endocarpon pusillum TaxID=364733 RepID=A0A8H7E2U0_9EURO|nr:hypothetical protein GJ744_012315 [Endocarpon pusillum]
MRCVRSLTKRSTAPHMNSKKALHKESTRALKRHCTGAQSSTQTGAAQIYWRLEKLHKSR